MILLEGAWVGSRRQRGRTTTAGRRWALEDVSLKIDAGERVAVLGSNASGKTTLLRTISRIYVPSRGLARVQGSVASVIDLSPGVERELTGNEVLPVRAALLGLRPTELARRRNEIVNFSGIDADTMAMPLAQWSAGTLLRLEFALAISIAPSIFAIDEVLAVADRDFRERAIELMAALREREAIVIFATHDLDLVAELADRAVVLEQGRVIADASAQSVVERLRQGGHPGRDVDHQHYRVAAIVDESRHEPA